MLPQSLCKSSTDIEMSSLDSFFITELRVRMTCSTILHFNIQFHTNCISDSMYCTINETWLSIQMLLVFREVRPNLMVVCLSQPHTEFVFTSRVPIYLTLVFFVLGEQVLFIRWWQQLYISKTQRIQEDKKVPICFPFLVSSTYLITSHTVTPVHSSI